MVAPKSPGQQVAGQETDYLRAPGSILLQQITKFVSPQCNPFYDLHPQIYLPVLNDKNRQSWLLGREGPTANFGFKSRGGLGIVWSLYNFGKRL